MTTDTDTAAIRPPCDCIEDNAPCHHGPRYAVSADTAPLSAEGIAKAELIAQLDRSGIPQAVAHDRAIDGIVLSHGSDMRRLAARVKELETDLEREQRNYKGALLIFDGMKAERNSAEARATQAEAERDALRKERDNLLDMIDGGQTMRDVARDQRDRWKIAEAALSASQAREAGMREELRFYANREHMVGDWDGWEDASGEPPNWLNAPDDHGAMLEDGGVARAAISHHREAQGGGNG